MKRFNAVFLLGLVPILLSACSTYSTAPSMRTQTAERKVAQPQANYASRLPERSPTGGKVILIDPNVHAWGAYGPNGELLRAGLVTAGGNWCPDIGRSCRTKAGTF